ncbi:phosphonate ABC transporter ATP-binding protein [Ramlibacter sp. H39-3-26]|uniref:phosphonate ABC transporter ATP-binding protein n=1 Tax=Curvibacter soli TaxID=3031331 RepID=UPI0023DAF55E|nr:phosphonate ABC transporter ATP-binding protein [Ramlibacter sp. H39-3-26]MDF1485674.1 phosphonate ABC transporter ATP-binding protein [Ramlibacter sp. H39-3-26]
MLTMTGVTCCFGDKAAVDDVSLTVSPGSFVGVIGRSGAGKSTLLRMINRLQTPTAGRIDFEGRDITALKGRALRAWRAECAMVFQQFNLVGRLDVLTNVMMGRLNHAGMLASLLGLWAEHDRAVVFSVLEQFEIGGLAAHRAETLSGGQQQRVAIARALVQEPRIILADEPTASLDPRNAIAVMEALRRINREYGISVICNLHSLDLARAYCGRLVGMAAGRVVFDGTPEDLTDAAARNLYGIEADEAIGAPGFAPRQATSGWQPPLAQLA